MEPLKNIFDADGKVIDPSPSTERRSEIYRERSMEEKRLKKIKRKITRLEKRLDEDFCCIDKAQRKKLKRKIKVYKTEKQVQEKKLADIEARLARTEESISLIIPEVLKFREYYRQQLIQQMSESTNPREIEGCLKLLERGVSSGKKL